MKLFIIILLTLISIKSVGQVKIQFGVEGMKENSIIMLNALCNCYGKDSVIYMLDSLSYFGVFTCEVNSKGYVVDIPMYRSKKSSFCKDDLIRIKNFLQDRKIKFSVVYINDLGETENTLKKRIRKELKRHFRQNKTIFITVGFPGNLSAPWERFLIH